MTESETVWVWAFGMLGVWFVGVVVLVGIFDGVNKSVAGFRSEPPGWYAAWPIVMVAFVIVGPFLAIYHLAKWLGARASDGGDS